MFVRLEDLFESEMNEASVNRNAQDAVEVIAKGLGINAKLTGESYHEYLLAEIKVGDRTKLAKVNREGTKEFGDYKITVYGGNKHDLEYASILSPKGNFKVAFGDARSIDNAVTFAMNESSSSELRKLAQVAAKTLGIKITETPDSFKPLMGAQFEITEKDYRKIVSVFKRAGSDPEELGFYDMTFDNHDMTVLIDFEDVDDSIQFYVSGMNESINEVTGQPLYKMSVPSHMI